MTVLNEQKIFRQNPFPKELKRFKKIIKNSLFESSYAAGFHFSPGNFTRLWLTAKFRGFEADESYGQVTNFGHLIAGRPRASKLNLSKPQSLSVSN